jgi:hypothetical protein
MGFCPAAALVSTNAVFLPERAVRVRLAKQVPTAHARQLGIIAVDGRRASLLK